MPSATEHRQRAERLVSLAASLQAVTQAPPPRARRPRWPWITALLLALAVTSLPFVRGLRPVDFLVRRWQIQSQMLSDIDASAQVRQLPALGEDGLPLLVHALTDSRPMVAEAAQETLDLEVVQWKQLPLADASRRAAKLLGLLRASSSNISPVVSDDIRSIVLELLRWPVDEKSVDGTALVADCEYVLARLYHPPAAIASEPSSSFVATINSATPREELGSVTQATEELGTETQATSDVPSGPSFSISDDSSEEDEALAEDIPVSTSVGSTDLAEPALVAPYSPRATSLQSSPDSQLNDVDLIKLGQQLCDARAEVVVQAANELRRRGFRDDHITLIEHLFDAEPAVRRAALDELPRISGLDSRPWLWHLAEDADASVRHTAIALMRTSGDPDTKRRLRELEIK